MRALLAGLMLAAVGGDLAGQKRERPIATVRVGSALYEVSAVSDSDVQLWATRGVNRVLAQFHNRDVVEWVASTARLVDSAVAVLPGEILKLNGPYLESGDGESISIIREATSKGSTYYVSAIGPHQVHHVFAATPRVQVKQLIAAFATAAKVAEQMAAPARLAAQQAAERERVYRGSEVTTVATPLPDSPTPQSSDAARRLGIAGTVSAHFVVDADGRPAIETLAIPWSSDPRLSNIVREHLSSMRFKPAQLDGRAVRQHVQMPFTFVK